MIAEPYFFYDRDNQLITIGRGQTISLAEFRQMAPDFQPPLQVDRIEYLPGVRVSMIDDGNQLGLPELAHLPDQTRWQAGDRYIKMAQERLAYQRELARRKA